MFTTYLFTCLMIISAAIAVILSVHNKHWLSGCFSAFTFGLAASIVIPIWNEPHITGYVMVGMFFLYHGITELKESIKPKATTYKEKKDVTMAINMPKDPNKVKTLCYKYKRQLKELTQKLENDRLNWGMEEYYLTQKIWDFEALCKQNNVDFTIVNERDAKRRQH